MTTSAQPTTAVQETGAKRIIVSEDLPLTVLTAVATTLVMNALGLGRSMLYIGVAVSPLVADVIKNAFRGLRKRWLTLLAALLALLGTAGRALAARLRARQDRKVGAHAMVSTAVVSAALTVALFTVFEIGSGNATIFFGPHSRTVRDHTPPRLTVPHRIVVRAPGPTAVPFRVSARDGVDGPVAVSCAPRSGSVFRLGETAVACSAADSHDNRATRVFLVTVNRTHRIVPPKPSPKAKDDVAPALALPGDQNVTTVDPSGRVVVYTVTADDNVDGAVPATCEPASGSHFPVGETTVTCAATDAKGNRATGSFAVHLTLSKRPDTTPPAIESPGAITVEATSPAGAVVTYTASARDGADGTVATNCLPASGTTFPLGPTRVRCSAHDAAGNGATGAFTVTVVDTTAPTLAPLTDLKVEATSPGGAVVPFEPVATDAVDGAVTPVCSPAPGSTFALGDTSVLCTATDRRGNRTSGGFSVTVVDTTAPTMDAPGDYTVEATSRSGALVRYPVSATDLVSGTVPVTCSPAAGTLPFGRTPVTCTATDAHENRSSASFTVTVADRTGPKLSLPGDSTVTAVYTHHGWGATITYPAPTALDVVDGAVKPSCTLQSGTWVSVPGTDTPKTIQCTAVDSHGNTSTGSFTVTIHVP